MNTLKIGTLLTPLLSGAAVFLSPAVHYNGLENLKQQCLRPSPELLIYLV